MFYVLQVSKLTSQALTFKGNVLVTIISLNSKLLTRLMIHNSFPSTTRRIATLRFVDLSC